MNEPLKVLFLTTEWPTKERPTDVPFLRQYAQALRDEGLQVEVFHFRGRGNPFNYLRAWFQVRKLPLWSQADIIHAHWGQSALLALFSRKPLVITFHGSDLQGIVSSQGKYKLKGKLLVEMNKWIARRADVCVAVSERLRKVLLDYNQQVEVIPMGIDLDMFIPMDKMCVRMELGLDPSKTYLLFVSDPLRPEKRFFLAQEAFAAANINNSELLVIKGQPYEKIPLFLNAGDLLLLTSSHEGSPVIIKEALACNLPVVSADVGDAKERLENIAGCVVCENDKVETIARAIRSALAYDQPINGREEMLGLSWELIAKRTIAVYYRVVKKSS